MTQTVRARRFGCESRHLQRKHCPLSIVGKTGLHHFETHGQGMDMGKRALCSYNSAARARTCWRASFVFDECHSLAATKPETPFREPSCLQQFIKEAFVDSELNGQLIFGFEFEWLSESIL
ncbi:hypothetical protein CEXT_540561 [Caerostris extrusa]|uniref:Uncharacterized protein n=1 Tax=Caerostris extrusa TaxID=172846 RepID=A0AAV4NCB8_CAEEX|nr:hypothetical protein CEXT_540561 [Caerostris extrusa]